MGIRTRTSGIMVNINVTPAASAPPAGFVGPGDIEPGAIGFWGLRAYSSTTIGSTLIELREDTGGTTRSFVSLADGSLDEASITTWSSGASLFVRTLYDQVGPNDWLQTSSASQPKFLFNQVDGKAAIVSTGATNQVMEFQLTTPTSVSQPFHWATAVWINTFDIRGYVGGETTGWNFGPTTVPSFRLSAPTALDGASSGATTGIVHSVQLVFNATGSVVCVDAAETAGDAGTRAIAAGEFMSLMAAFVGANSINGRLTEVGLWSGAGNATTRSNMSANVLTYWSS